MKIKQTENNSLDSNNDSSKDASGLLPELITTADGVCKIETSIGTISLGRLKVGHMMDYENITAFHDGSLINERISEEDWKKYNFEAINTILADYVFLH